MLSCSIRGEQLVIFIMGVDMYQNVYVPDRYRAWFHECGDVIENQQTGEWYIIVEDEL